MFFNCIVAKLIWSEIAVFLGRPLGANIESLAHYWIANNSHVGLSSICIVLLWFIWSLRNDIIFNGITLLSMT
jgi:membrane protein DedA with SNARE-associated domain